jgi:hypothetical protein
MGKISSSCLSKRRKLDLFSLQPRRIDQDRGCTRRYGFLTILNFTRIWLIHLKMSLIDTEILALLMQNILNQDRSLF